MLASIAFVIIRGCSLRSYPRLLSEDRLAVSLVVRLRIIIKYIDFEAYERVAEPHKREVVSAWRTAIGLQDVAGLRVSDYLKNDIC